MGMRIVRTEFLDILARVEPGRSARDVLEQSGCYVFSDGWCATFNDEICCRTKTPFPEDFQGAVPGQPLVKVLENMVDDEVELRPGDRELQIIGRRKKAGIRMESEILLPTESVTPPKKWHNLPEGFAEAIRQVASVAGTDEEEFLTVCVMIGPKQIEACDCVSAAKYEIETPVSGQVLVKAKSIKHTKDLGLTRIGETQDWIHLRNETIIFSVRRYIDDFFDTAPLWAFRGTPTTLPKGAVHAARLGGVFSSEDKDDDRVSVNLSDGHMNVRGEGAHGWAEEDLETTYRGEKVSFRISPSMLEQLVTDHNSVEISATKLRVTGEKWSFLTTLGRPDAREKDKKRTKPEPVAVAAEEENTDGADEE